MESSIAQKSIENAENAQGALEVEQGPNAESSNQSNSGLGSGSSNI